jgi:hypothetical protein
MTTGTCSSCKRSLASAGVGAVTEDTAKFCFGTGTKACIEYTRRIETAPGEPLPNPFGMSDETKAKIGKVVKGALGAAGVVGLLALGAKAMEEPARRAPPKRGRGGR